MLIYWIVTINDILVYFVFNSGLYGFFCVCSMHFLNVTHFHKWYMELKFLPCDWPLCGFLCLWLCPLSHTLCCTCICRILWCFLHHWIRFVLPKRAREGRHWSKVQSVWVSALSVAPPIRNTPHTWCKCNTKISVASSPPLGTPCFPSTQISFS